MKLKIISFALLAICVSCQDVKKEQLIGRFVFQANVKDTLDVSSDGTYSYYTWSEKNKLENSGTWLYDSSGGYVVFHDFSFLPNLSTGIWPTKIKTSDNEVRLIYASEVYKGYFLRIDSIDRKK